MTDARKALAAKMAFQLKHYSDARLTPTEAKFVIAALRSPLPGTREDDDPSVDDRWNNGCDFAMTQLCKVLGVDQESVSWDAATETVDGDVRAVIGNIMRAKYGEDWSPSALPPAPMPEREGMRGALAYIACGCAPRLRTAETFEEAARRVARAALAPHDKTEGK